MLRTTQVRPRAVTSGSEVRCHRPELVKLGLWAEFLFLKGLLEGSGWDFGSPSRVFFGEICKHSKVRHTQKRSGAIKGRNSLCFTCFPASFSASQPTSSLGASQPRLRILRKCHIAPTAPKLPPERHPESKRCKGTFGS